MKVCRKGLHEYEGKQCRECKRAYHAKWKAENPEKVRANSRTWAKANAEQEKIRHRAKSLKKNTGATVEQYNQMFTDQNGNCAICNNNQSQFPIRLAVDHCHNTGKIRGLLCMLCNTALGRFNDDAEMILKAYNYLKKGSRQ